MNRGKKIFNILIYILVIIVFILLISIPVFVYYKQFRNNDLSYDSSDWGNFGDYLNGTIIPLLTIINTIILFNLMKTANKIQEQSAKLDRKHRIFKPYTDKINTIFSDIQLKYSSIDTQESIKLLSILYNQFEEFVKENKSFFDKDKESYEFIKEKNDLIKSKILSLKGNLGNIDLLGDIFKEKYILFDKINEKYNL